MEPVGAGYEFNPAENVQLTRLRVRMGILAYALIVGGVAFTVCGATVGSVLVLSDMPSLWGRAILLLALGGPLAVVLGFQLRRSAASIQRVVDTEGADISHLMQALDRLRRFVELSAVLAVGMVMVVLAVTVKLAIQLRASNPLP